MWGAALAQEDGRERLDIDIIRALIVAQQVTLHCTDAQAGTALLGSTEMRTASAMIDAVLRAYRRSLLYDVAAMQLQAESSRADCGDAAFSTPLELGKKLAGAYADMGILIWARVDFDSCGDSDRDPALAEHLGAARFLALEVEARLADDPDREFFIAYTIAELILELQENCASDRYRFLRTLPAAMVTGLAD